MKMVRRMEAVMMVCLAIIAVCIALRVYHWFFPIQPNLNSVEWNEKWESRRERE